MGTIRQTQPEDVRSVQLASVHPDLRRISVAVCHLKISSRSQLFAKAPRTPVLLDAVVAAALAILPLEGCVIGQDPITTSSFEAAPSRTSTAWAVHAASTFLINYHGLPRDLGDSREDGAFRPLLADMVVGERDSGNLRSSKLATAQPSHGPLLDGARS